MSRYICNTSEEQKEMLAEIGLGSVGELFGDIPDSMKLNRNLNLPAAEDEMSLLRHMRRLASENANFDDYACFLGAGAYDHFIPSVLHHLTGRQEFYTAYTPYQPEISQGTLQAIFEYQTMICRLTGMDAANASMYDGATALVEAMLMVCRSTGRKRVVIPDSLNPEYKRVLETYARFNSIDIYEVPSVIGQLDSGKLEALVDSGTAAVIVQSPNFFGIIEDMQAAADIAHKQGAMLIASVDPISLALLKTPGECGADVATGEGQALGNPASFGGPYLGFFAVKKELVRKMPGRLVGQTVDNRGNTGYVLTIQAREQHIRREKATSNICSNEALNALTAAVYLSAMGPEGLKQAAEACVRKAHYTCSKLLQTGKFELCFTAPFFKEFAVKCKEPVDAINRRLLENKIIGGYCLQKAYPSLGNAMLIAVTEKRTMEEIDRFVEMAGGNV